MTFQYANNSTAATPPPTNEPFIITAPPNTDIWRKPPNLDVFTAPILYRTLPLAKFGRVRVTVSAGWKTLYDQGGLFFARPQGDGSLTKKWIKAGIEFFDGRACASVVAAEKWADWSLAPIESESVTLEFAREPPLVASEGTGTKKVPSLWVYLVEGEEGRRRPIREVKWPFVRDDGGVVVGEEEECWVGVYAAKPTASQANPSEGLEVRFSGLTIE